MKEFTTTTSIKATPESVWAILTDAPGYTHWNPEITRIGGRIALGEKIRAHVNLGGGVIRPVTVRVTALELMRRMVWTGGLPLGLFTGRRTFSLKPRDGYVLGSPTWNAGTPTRLYGAIRHNSKKCRASTSCVQRPTSGSFSGSTEIRSPSSTLLKRRPF